MKQSAQGTTFFAKHQNSIIRSTQFSVKNKIKALKLLYLQFQRAIHHPNNLIFYDCKVERTYHSKQTILKSDGI